MNLLTRRYGRPEPRFRPQFLGEKYPMIDIFVELVGRGGDENPFFFAQVRSTSRGYNELGRLRGSVSVDEMEGLVRYLAPTYVVGVDEVAERAFIMAATVGGITSFSSLPVSYPLEDEKTLQALYNEVGSFWRTSATRFTTSQFT